VKTSESLEQAGAVDAVVLDKTGTVTKGQPQVTDIVLLDEAWREEDFLVLAASAETGSEHPLGEAIQALANSETIATILPNCSLFLGIPFADARQLMQANIPVALASDFNPGSSPSGNMNLVVSLACIKQKMLPEEAIHAATLNGAAALELSHAYGSISRGKKANLLITKEIPSLAYLPYAFGASQVQKVILNGKLS
jgi:imidazolonepropionase